MLTARPSAGVTRPTGRSILARSIINAMTCLHFTHCSRLQRRGPTLDVQTARQGTADRHAHPGRTDWHGRRSGADRRRANDGTAVGTLNSDTVEFDVENKRVAPAIEVDLDPALWGPWHDPHLEKGVSVALQELTKHLSWPMKRPQYPVDSWQKVRPEEARRKTASGAGSGQEQ